VNSALDPAATMKARPKCLEDVKAVLPRAVDAPGLDSQARQALGIYEKAVRALYVGTGGGRRALALAARGWDLTCLEPNRKMNSARQRTWGAELESCAGSINWVESSIEAWLAGTSARNDFEVVLAPDMVLNCGARRSESEARLALCSAALGRGGILIADWINEWAWIDSLPPAGAIERIMVGAEPAWFEMRYRLGEYRPDEGYMQLFTQYRLNYDNGELQEFIDLEELYTISAKDVLASIEEAGLEVIGGDLDDSPGWRLTLVRT
jgi:SAM-dependent methyltransferase